jgi:hypothetical protein
MSIGFSLGIGFQSKNSLLYREVLNFIEVASITNSVEQNALIQLVVDLKNVGLWDKMDVIYPFIGGTALSNSFNLKNTNQYQITWYGTVTHNSNGITGDGSSGYGDTNYDISAVNNFSLGIYSRTNVEEATYEIGSFNSSLNNTATYLRIKVTDTMLYNINSIEPSSVPNSDSSGFFASSRVSNMDLSYNIRGISTTITKVSDNTPNLNLYILGLNFNNSLFGASSKNLAFCYLSKGLTSNEINNLATIVQDFQTALGRNI